MRDRKLFKMGWNTFSLDQSNSKILLIVISPETKNWIMVLCMQTDTEERKKKMKMIGLGWIWSFALIWLISGFNFCFFIRTIINSFQSSVLFHIETIHLVCTVNQMTRVYFICNTGLKWVKQIEICFTFYMNCANDCWWC